MSALRQATISPYLQAIWTLQHEDRTRVGVAVLAERLGRTVSTVSQGVRDLAAARLIHHEPYGPIELTLKGEQLAVAAIRHERIARAFLFHVLEYAWADVATEATQLSPALDSELAKRLHRVAGSPSTDPYGHPIPGTAHLPTSECRPLSEQATDIELRIERVHSSSLAFLERVHALGLTPGSTVCIEATDPAAEVITLRCGDTAHTLGMPAARKILAAAAPRSGDGLDPDRVAR